MQRRDFPGLMGPRDRVSRANLALILAEVLADMLQVIVVTPRTSLLGVGVAIVLSQHS